LRPALCFVKHIALLLIALSLPGGVAGCRRPPTVVVATTTSLQDSGLLDRLVPAFQAETGYRVKVVAVGSGQALELVVRGEVDAALTHCPPRERELLEAGVLAQRHEVMYNAFWLVGPVADPAGAAGLPLPAALAAVASSGAPFFSRGDGSGTHLAELALWEEIGVSPAGAWYQRTGQGMAATLRVAAERRAYALTDSATFLGTGATAGLVRLDRTPEPRLNVYSVVLPAPGRHPAVNYDGAEEFVRFILSDTARTIIEDTGLYHACPREGD